MLEIFQMKGKLLACKYNGHSSLLATRAVSWGEIVKHPLWCGTRREERGLYSQTRMPQTKYWVSVLCSFSVHSGN